MIQYHYVWGFSVESGIKAIWLEGSWPRLRQRGRRGHGSQPTTRHILQKYQGLEALDIRFSLVTYLCMYRSLSC